MNLYQLVSRIDRKYWTAAGISSLVTGVIPLILAASPFLLALFWLLLWGINFISSVFSGVPLDTFSRADQTIASVVVVPFYFSLYGVIAILITLLVVIAFNLLIILPFSLIMELLNQRIARGHAWMRLVTFLLGGVLLGCMIGWIGASLAKYIAFEDPFLKIIGNRGIGILLALFGFIAELAFGVTVTIMDKRLPPSILNVQNSNA